MSLLGQFQTFFYEKISQAQKKKTKCLQASKKKKKKRQRFMRIKNI